MAEILFNLAAEILKSLGSLATEEVASIYGLRDELKNLSATVSSIQAVLIDAEEQQGSSNLISHRLKSIRRDLELIAKDKASLYPVERREPFLREPYSVQFNLDRETYSFVPEGEVIGRNDDKKKIVDFLLDSKVEENVVVISIVGLGGLGKTTLAQCVFNDEMVKENFEKNIVVQNELRRMLDGKKYLLVLDDVWNEDPLKWPRLKNMLIGGAKGSKIFLTTHSDMVAEVSGSAHQHKLRDLSEEEAWILFEKMAFGCNKESENSNLVEIGKEIVRKCGGVPLAIRSVGSLLRLKRTEDEWIYFKNKDLSSITRGGNDEMVILRLSYNHLPQHLKICFAYCSLYPKDFKIGRFDLITMWNAQGFIQATTSNTDNVEDVANSYFMDLLRRSLFQETEEHESFMQFYKIHDLIHDLAIEVADRDFFNITKTEDTEVLPEQTLYASCLFKIDGSSAFPNSFYRKHMKLRAFIFLNQSSINVLSNSTLERMISSFSRLRLLHLGHLKIEFLSQYLGGLKHLRYLCISSWSISTLQNSITKLHNLQVLKLDDCGKLKYLPRDIWRLVSLRRLLKSLMHLDLDDFSSLEDMPPGIGQLTYLRTLTSFIMGKESCISGQESDKLNELKGLVDLRNSLRIKFMGCVRAIGERTPTGVVKRMKHLRQRSVEFEYGNHGDVDPRADLMMLDALQPHQNIEKLRIENYSGSMFPSWLMVENLGILLPKLILALRNLGGLEGYDDKFMQPSKTPSDERFYFSSLKQLELKGINEKILKKILCPPPHYPYPLCNLKRLFHARLVQQRTMQFQAPGNLSAFRVVWLDKLMSLPLWLRHFSATLKSINLFSCPNFTTIPEWIGDFIALNRLEIANCRMLTSFPEGLRSLTALQTLNIFWCSSILMKRCKKEVGEDWPKIVHIPTVDIQDSGPGWIS
ncbi:putative disease resistance protein RGA3 [Capsicum annuum]|uniref:putative disease resistance protein RGA3 n=1 Tax=Capsicum annuum TaxID=4072 RepID=UPI001FB09C6B|nr:putative disease resistance protein RGA3 [Capsicum annuum]